MGFSRQEYWSGLPCPSLGDFSTQESNPSLLRLLHWQVCSLPLVLPKKCQVKVFVAQYCPALCDSTDCSPPGSTVHEILQASILEWLASHSLLQGIFLTRGLNLSLLRCRQILYHPSHQGRIHARVYVVLVVIC